MNKSIDLKKILEEQVRPAIQKTLGGSAVAKKSETIKVASPATTQSPSATLTEAINIIPRSFPLKTEKLSGVTKSSHENLYKSYVESLNKTSSALDAASREDSKSSASAFRSLKDDETYNLNGIKLHELYFANISDVASEISMDSVPYIRLARDFGTFEKWQFDFMACAMAARNGWAITVFDPYKNIFMNCVVDSHNKNIPLFTIPVLVLDMWEHAYFRDYADDKKSYIINMMREINWDVVEARMSALEDCKLDKVYRMVAEHNPAPEKIAAAANVAPVETVPPTNMNSAPGPQEPVAPPAPAVSPGVPTKV
jgi:Fe-Mn family superoxide dismutase